MTDSSEEADFGAVPLSTGVEASLEEQVAMETHCRSIRSIALQQQCSSFSEEVEMED